MKIVSANAKLFLIRPFETLPLIHPQFAPAHNKILSQTLYA